MNDPVIVEVPDGNDYAVLACVCGEPNGLHHDKVVVYNRNEDEPEAQMTVVEHGRVLVNEASRDTGPSCRRDGLSVSFWCELCGRRGMKLHIIQHKGQTHLSWGEWSDEELDDSVPEWGEPHIEPDDMDPYG